MTKRAGRKKNRNGSQRHPPGPTEREPTLVRDDLPPAESQQLEWLAVRSGWLVGDPKYDRIRELLLRKMATAAGNTNDPEILCKIVRTFSQIEQRQQMIDIAKQRLESGPRRSELPAANLAPPTELQSQPFLVIQQLIAQREVRDALHPPAPNNGPNQSDSVGAMVNQQPVQDGAASRAD